MIISMGMAGLLMGGGMTADYVETYSTHHKQPPPTTSSSFIITRVSHRPILRAPSSLSPRICGAETVEACLP